MDKTMIEVAELREGDVFELPGVGTFGVVRIWGGGVMRTIHLEAWRQGEGCELKLRSAIKVRLVSRAPDDLLKRVQDERTAASLASFDALVREIDEAPDAPDDGLAHDDWEVPPSPDAVAQVREALRRADRALTARWRGCATRSSSSVSCKPGARSWRGSVMRRGRSLIASRRSATSCWRRSGRRLYPSRRLALAVRS